MAEEETEQHLLRIKPFNGTEFDTWESNLKLILEQHSVLNVFEESPPNPNDTVKAAKFTQNDIKARFIITQAVANHMQVFIKDQKTAKGMLECLRRDFGPETTEKLDTHSIHIWTDDETKRLLSFYHQLIPELQSGRITTKDKMMLMIEKKMDGVVTAAQCYNRIKSLQRSFRLHKNGKGGRTFRSKYADIMEAIENGTHDHSATYFDLNGEAESMDVDCDPEHANASKQIYESTTLIPRTWSEEETMRLLDLYNQLKPELVVGSISSQEKVMEIIAQEMGGHLTPLQCLNKFKNVRAAYKNYKKDPTVKKFKYADAMEAIEGGDPDHSVAEEANDESHEIVIVGQSGEILSEDDTNDGETDAAITFITGDTVDTQDDSRQSEEEDSTEQRNYMAWSHTNTVKLLTLVENFASQVGSPQVRSRARMWVLVARRMGKTVTPDQCSSRWKTLEKSYKKAVAQGRGSRHPYSTQMKNVHTRLNDALLPIGSKLVVPTKPTRSSDDITFLLENFDNSMDGDAAQDEISSSPRVTEVYSLLPNETDEPEGKSTLDLQYTSDSSTPARIRFTGDALWSHENTLKLIELYKQLKSHVGTFKMRTHKKMWQVIAEHMGGNLNASKCENRWRVLERKYRKHLSISNTLGLKGRSIKAFEYFPQMDAILNWSSDNPANPPIDINPEFSGVHLSSSTMSAPPVDILATSSFETAQRSLSEDAEEDLDVNKEKIPYKLRILERMRRDKKAYYTQMLIIHRERLDIEQQRLEELKRKNKILERSVSISKKT